MTVRNCLHLTDSLNQLLAGEARGLSRHLRQADPYLTGTTYPVWHNLQQMIRTSEHHAQRLSQMLDAYELPPRPNCFDPVVANFHFADLAYLFPLLIEEKRTQIVAYQHALEQAAGHEELIAQLASLLDENQTALDVLERDHRQIAAGSKIAQHG